MKLFIKIILISIWIFTLIEISNAWLLPRFESYKKKVFERKVYEINDYGSEYEIKWADYWSFKYWDSYAHDKNSLYIAWNIVQKRINLDNSFDNFYDDVIYTKDNKIYYKNKHDDLIEVTTKWDNLKVLYNTEWFIWIINNDLFLNLDKSQYWFYNDNHLIDIENWCNISTLEYTNWYYFDWKNVCWYAYLIPKKLIEELNNKIVKKLDNLSRWEINDIHNTIYNKRSELYEKINKSEYLTLKDLYFIVSMDYILEYIYCNIEKEIKDYIWCKALQRRRTLIPNKKYNINNQILEIKNSQLH